MLPKPNALNFSMWHEGCEVQWLKLRSVERKMVVDELLAWKCPLILVLIICHLIFMEDLPCDQAGAYQLVFGRVWVV